MGAGVESMTVTLKLFGWALLPAESCAEHVTVVVPSLNMPPDGGSQLGLSDPSRSSVAETRYLTSAPSSLIAGTSIGLEAVMTGGVRSIGLPRVTVTLKLFGSALLPAESCAEHVTVVVPSLNIPPDGGSQLGLSDPSRSSVAETRYLTSAPSSLIAGTSIGLEAVMTGGVRSIGLPRVTVTLKLFGSALLPAESCAEHVTVVVPSLNIPPDGGSQLGLSDPSRLSVANTE